MIDVRSAHRLAIYVTVWSTGVLGCSASTSRSGDSTLGGALPGEASGGQTANQGGTSARSSASVSATGGASSGTPLPPSTSISVPSDGGTEISAGSVSGTWGRLGSPYRVNGDITIDSGKTLTVEPGVIVAFSGRYKFVVYGGLVALGTADQRIAFTTTEPTLTWWGMLVDHCATHGTGVCSISAASILPTQLKYTVFEHARKDSATDRDWFAGGALNFNGNSRDDNHLSIVNSIFRNNYAIDGGGGVHLLTGNAFVFGCLFVNNTSGSTGSAFGFEHGGGRVLNCTVTNNNGLGAIDSFDTGTERNNLIFGNRDKIRDWGDVHVKWDMSFNINDPNSYTQLALHASDISGIDPSFIAPNVEDYRLTAGSKAIDVAENPSSLLVGGESLPETDLAGQPRGCGASMDVGAYEYCL